MMKRILFFAVASLISCNFLFAQLVKTTWGQGSPFNKYCPTYVDTVNNQAVTNVSAVGCGAVALGHVLNYYRMPKHGYGSVVENDSVIDLSTITLDYDHIRDNYNGSYTTEEVDAVATLLHVAGLSMNMHYGKSSAPRTRGRMMWGLQHHLHIDPNSRYLHRRNYSTEEWMHLIDEHLENDMPLIYRGTYYDTLNKEVGHIFVLDGKDEIGKYHINFGRKNDSNDKYVTLSCINQSNGDEVYPGGKSVCYYGEQAMIVNCVPMADVSNSDYESHPMILENPFVFNDNLDLDSAYISSDDSVKISFTLLDCSMEAGIVYYGMGIFNGDSLIDLLKLKIGHSYTFKNAGASQRIYRLYTLPKDFPDGNYEVRLLYRHDEKNEWKECWSDALNKMALTVNDGRGMLRALQSSRKKALFLVDDIQEVIEQRQTGRIYEVKLMAPANAYYEGPLKFSFDIEGKQYDYTHNVAVYENTSVVYRVYIPYSEVPASSADPHVVCYYQPGSTFMMLEHPAESSILTVQQDASNETVCIYSLFGMYVAKCSVNAFSETFDRLKPGMYLILGCGTSKKMIKY